MKRVRPVRFPWPALLACLLSLPAYGLEFEPSITLAEIYTNNVDLAPDGQEESEWVTRAAPRIEIGYQGGRLALDLDYTLEALFYAEDSDRNEVYNQLNSSALLNLIGEDLRLRAAVVIDQVNVEPEKPTSNSNINTTGNRSDSTAWVAGPEWRRDVLGNSEVTGYATAGHVDYDSPDSQDVDTVSGRFSVHTDPRSRSVGSYELAYEYDGLDYQVSGETVLQTAYLKLGYQVNDNLEVFALGGMDNDIEDPTDTGLSEGRWEVGVASELGDHTLQAAVGHRYFGPTYAFSWDLEGSQSRYRLSFNQAPSTSDLTALNELPTDPTAPDDPVPPDSDINRPGNPTRYVQSRADADATWELHRSELHINLFWEKREDEVFVTEGSPVVSDLDNEESYGFNADFQWDIGPRSVALLAASWRHRTYNDIADSGCDPLIPGSCDSVGDTDQLTTLLAGVDYTLGRKTGLGFRTGMQRRAGTPGGSGNYDELWASVQLVRTF